MSHIRARAATSPYPREHSDSVHSSSSETDEIAMFLSSQAQQQDFHNHHHHHHHQVVSHQQQPMFASPAHLSHDHFGRMQAVQHHSHQHLRLDHGLEQLAANVRSATTTSASDRAKQIFVQAWLNANYATYPDGNVPRQGLYMSYRRVCDQYNIPHINTATLGKAIRLCFPTIKTRRLGVRGNSKYHYCGIRPSTQAEVEWLQDYVRKSNNNKANADSARASGKSGDEGGSDAEDDDESSEGGGGGPLVSKRGSLTINGAKGMSLVDPSDKTPTAKSILTSASQPPRSTAASSYASTRIRRSVGPEVGLGPAPHPTVPTAAPAAYLSHRNISVRNLPNFPSIEEAVGSSSTTPHGLAAREVWGWFEAHLDQLLDSIRTFRCDQFEMHLRTFWQNLTGEYREVVHAPAIAGLMAKADAILYDILETLRSQMLQPIPPQSLTSLRQLADKMEKILMVALENYGNTFVEPKVELGARFGHLVLRCLDIFQVTQALHTVLTNPKQVQEMRRSWMQIDFDSVRNQSALVCNCRQEDLAQLLEVDFVSMLDSVGASVEPVKDVMAWADDICDRLVANRAGMTSAEDKSTLSSRSVLIRWGYVTSQIMRDLTIRSDPTFGAFQILKLFLDDWIALNVLRSVALSTNSVAASVEPPMPQQFFQMSPMASNDFGSGMNGQRGDMMHPTSSSMLAALSADFPPASLDGANGFGSSFGNGLSYMESSGSSMPFQDFVQPSSNPFDFNQDLSLGASRGVLDGDRDLVTEEPVQDPVL
ncbi:RFX DNA-binding domain-containing protein [Auriculariales sp. MPI-PUGE-AT-0066]|nr:RFX DNA-binding domain-containing protein [Auriculariales sp. MPI-PUGE-AT-0066]